LLKEFPKLQTVPRPVTKLLTGYSHIWNFQWKLRTAGISFHSHKSLDLLYTQLMCMSLNLDLSVADNARDAVLIHVSASSERQEWRNKTDAMMKTTERHVLTHTDACRPSILCFYKLDDLVMQVTQYITPHTLTVSYWRHILFDAEMSNKTKTVYVIIFTLLYRYIKIFYSNIQEIKDSIWLIFYSKCHTYFVDYLHKRNMRR
jgi:hypothetical protein